MITSKRSATSRVSQFLDQLLRSFVEPQVQSTIFVNGADFMRQLIQYTDKEHRLLPTTLFVTITIVNFEHVTSHATMLMTLEGFFNDRMCTPAIDNISAKRIVQLTSLVLSYNRFYYNRKIYRFTRGGPSSSPFMRLLSTIYMFQWQRQLLNEPLVRCELFGR